MTPREKIAHLYRRFGFGILPEELDRAEKAGVDAAIRNLIDYPDIPDKVSPHEFVWREKEEADLGSYRYRAWWIFQMLTTEQPLREKLAIFWHGHFAVSDSKVEDGPMMLEYLQSIRRNASGKFSTLLETMSKEPAMMRYLDMQRSIRGNPNENFAREVMELFSLGIGNYTEKDVQEVSRALTGWGYINTFWEEPGTSDAKLKRSIQFQRPFSAFTYMPAMHDPTPKTILGQTKQFNGEDVLAILANHPVTAKRICKKLWEYFVYESPEDAVIDKLAATYKKTNGNTREVLRAITKTPEFWSQKSIRQLVKSPADLCIPIARQMGIGKALLALRDPSATALTRIPNKILDNLWGISDRMEKSGLNLLYPVDVSGWKGGRDWISPASMIERYRFRGTMIWGEKGAGEATKFVRQFIVSKNPKKPEDVARAFAELFDVSLPPASLEVLTKAVERHGGMNSLLKDDAFTGQLHNTLGVLIAAPEMHFC